MVGAMKISHGVGTTAPVAGFLLGFLDFVWIKYVPFPFGGLGNSIAVWAVAAFLLTFHSRWSLPRATVGAVVFLVVAVPSYYVAAALIQNDDWANVYSSYSLLWMSLGVVAGAVFGAGGGIARTPSRRRIPALALPAAVLFAEAVLQLFRIGDPGVVLSETLGYVGVLVAAALGITLVVVPAWRVRAQVLACAVPLTAAGGVLLFASGFR
ncbi:hypothetical protein GCM10010109_34320 [Actinoplanes campanulatus]|nr:hypothetical protein GCM10010109_34320 [Actinoplanes campanulatus]GID35718.1 hypothetical protein Aca09nite_22240 [Actinoplanes campanulatus]